MNSHFFNENIQSLFPSLLMGYVVHLNSLLEGLNIRSKIPSLCNYNNTKKEYAKKSHTYELRFTSKNCRLGNITEPQQIHYEMSNTKGVRRLLCTHFLL